MDNNPNIMQVRHDQLDALVAIHLESKQPMFLTGSPGSGKSAHLCSAVSKARVSWAEQWYADRNLEYGGFDIVELRMAERDAADVRGVPKTIEDVVDGESVGWITTWCRPKDYPALDCRPTLLFVDELMQAHQSVSVLIGRAFDQDNRQIGDYVLPDNVVVFGASNFHTDRAGANRMGTQTANRVFHYELVVDAKQWCDEYAISADIDRRIVGFIRTRPELVYQFDAKSSAPAFASLRMWENLSTMIKDISNDNIVMLNMLACGAVGMGVGTEFTGFVRAYGKLPKIADIIADPDKYDDPVEADMRYAVGGALAKYADDDTIEACWTYMLKLPAEYQVLFVKDVQANLKNSGFDITQHPMYVEIISIHKEMLTQ